MLENYIEQKDLNNFKVYLYTPGGTDLGELITFNESLKLSLSAPLEFNFSVPVYIEGQENPKLQYMLDNYVIEIRYGELDSDDTSKSYTERFVINKTPKTFQTGVSSYNFSAYSLEVKNNRLAILGWLGVDKRRHTFTTGVYTAGGSAVTQTITINNFDDKYALNVIQYNKNDNPYTLIEVDSLSELKEGRYYFDGTTVSIRVPAQTTDGGNALFSETDTYYYEAICNLTIDEDPGATWVTYQETDGLLMEEVLQSLIDYAGSKWTFNIISDFSDKYRSNFQYNNVNLGEAISKTLEAYDAIAEYDRVNLVINIYDSQDYGEDKDLTIGYGKYLTNLTKDEDATLISTRIFATGKEGVGISNATITGEPYYEDYDYYLDGATYHNEGTAENPNWVLDTGSRWMSDSLTLNLSVWQNEVVGSDALQEEFYGDGNYLGLVQYLERSYVQLFKLLERRKLLDEDLIIWENRVTITEGWSEQEFEDYAGISKQYDNVTYNGDYQAYLKAVVTSIEQDLSDVNAKISYRESHYTGSGSYDPADYIQLNDLNNDNYGISEIEQRMDYVAEQVEKDKWLSPSDLDELYHYEKDFTYSNTTIESPYDLYIAARDDTVTERTIKIVYTINSIDILGAGEAKEDWHKLRVGDYINVYVKQLDVDIKAQIKEINVNLQSHTMGFVVSNIKDLRDTNPARAVAGWINNLNGQNKNLLKYNETDWSTAKETSDDNAQTLEEDIDTKDRHVQSGTDTNDEYTVALEQGGLTINSQEIDPTTDEIWTSGGYLPGNLEKSTNTIRIANGGLYIYEKVAGEDIVRIGITADAGFVSNAGITKTVMNANEGVVIKIDPEEDGIYDEYVFEVNPSGNLKAKGDITATSGSFGGWSADDETKFYSGSGNSESTLKADGTIYTYDGSGGNRYSYMKSGGTYAFMAGAAAPSSYPYDDGSASFRVEHDGTLHATGAVIGAGSGSTFSGTLVNADGSISGVTGSVSNLGGSLNNMGGNVTNLGGSLNNMGGNVTNLSGSLNNMGGNVTNLTGTVSNMDGNVTNLTGTVSNMDGSYIGTHNDGYVGGWTIESNYIYANSERTVLMNTGVIYVKNAADSTFSLMKSDGIYAFAAGSTTVNDSNIDNATFSVTHLGALKSTSGEIGSWNIDDTSLQSTNIGLNSTGQLWVYDSGNGYSGLKAGGTTALWAGGGQSASNSTGSAFRVDHDGDVFAENATITCDKLVADTSGSIGGWTINQDELKGEDIVLSKKGYVDVTLANGKHTGMSGSGTYSFYAGSDGIESITGANFTVTQDGNISASSASVSGSISAATSGRISLWYINSNSIYSDSYGRIKGEYEYDELGVNRQTMRFMSANQNSYLNVYNTGTSTGGIKIYSGSSAYFDSNLNIYVRATGTLYLRGKSGDVFLQANHNQGSTARYVYATNYGYSSSTSYRVTTGSTGVSSKLVKKDIEPLNMNLMGDFLDKVEIKHFYNFVENESGISMIIEDEQEKNTPYSDVLFTRIDRQYGYEEPPEWLIPHLNNKDFVTKIEEEQDDGTILDRYYINPLNVKKQSLIGINTAAAKYNHQRIKKLENEVKNLKELVEDLLSK